MSAVYKKVTKEVDELQDVLCDSCGKSCKDELGMNFEYMQLHADFGYASHHDTQSWSAQLCVKCVEDKLGFIKFNITHQF